MPNETVTISAEKPEKERLGEYRTNNIPGRIPEVVAEA
jgi:hypothetical protein